MLSACICINETDAMTELQNTQDISLASRGIPTAKTQDINNALETQPEPFAIQSSPVDPLHVTPISAVESQPIDERTRNEITPIYVDLSNTNNTAYLTDMLGKDTSIHLVIKSKIERLSSELFEQFLGKDNVAMLKSKVQSISIPNSVTEIADNCFKEWKNLSTVSFGSSSTLVRVGKEAFANSGLTEISIPDSVKVIDDSCFSCCSCLLRVIFGTNSTLERIGAYAFVDSGLREISIPDSVKVIDACCFKFCNRLTSISFGSSSQLERIGKWAFAHSNLREISIPDSVKVIDDSCFEYCQLLRRVIFGINSTLEHIGVSAFAYSGLTEISIPDSVTEIDNWCFHLCYKLARVIFGTGSILERIGKDAFLETNTKVYGLSPEKMNRLEIPKENRP